MTAASPKTPVRIVCPHCRRSYVIKVDLHRIYQTRPRAICSRCGGRFEVVQRMYEISEDGPVEKVGRATTDAQPAAKGGADQAARAARPRRQRAAQDAAAEDHVETRVPRPASRTPAPSAQAVAAARRARTSALPAESAGTAAAAAPPSPPAAAPAATHEQAAAPPAAADVHAAARPPRPTPAPSTAVEDATASPQAAAPPRRPREEDATPVETPAAKARGSEPDEEPMAPAIPSPIGDFDLGESSAEVQIPLPPDLDAPLPWFEKARASLDGLTFRLPESAEALEWLLTERPSRPRGASPPPIPVGTSTNVDEVLDADVVDEEHLVDDEEILDGEPLAATTEPRKASSAPSRSPLREPQPAYPPATEGGAAFDGAISTPQPTRDASPPSPMAAPGDLEDLSLDEEISSALGLVTDGAGDGGAADDDLLDGLTDEPGDDDDLS